MLQWETDTSIYFNIQGGPPIPPSCERVGMFEVAGESGAGYDIVGSLITSYISTSTNIINDVTTHMLVFVLLDLTTD